MATDQERREVARRLRESAGNGEVLRDVFLEEILAGDTGLWFAEDIEIDTLLYHLADLIEPSGHECVPGECPINVRHDNDKIDRDALLALADEIEDNDVTYCISAQYVLNSYADRIRKALGVSQ